MAFGGQVRQGALGKEWSGLSFYYYRKTFLKEGRKEKPSGEISSYCLAKFPLICPQGHPAALQFPTPACVNVSDGGGAP